MSDAVPMTDIEQAFWAYDRASVSNLCVAAAFTGPVSVESLRTAVECVAARHPYLRHTFQAGLLVPGQASVAWSEARGSWRSMVEKELHTPFDLSASPLVRACLFRPRAGQNILIVTFPHLIADGSGASHWVREVFDELDGVSLSERAFLRPRSDAFDARRAQPPQWSWSDGVHSLSAVALGGNPAASSAPPNRASLRFFRLSRQHTAALLQFCAANDITLNAYLSAVAIVVLGNYWRGLGVPVMKVSATVDYRSMLAIEPSAGDLGLWAGRLHLWASAAPAAPVLGLARGFQSGLFHLLRKSAFFEMAGMARGDSGPPRDGLALPLLKITNLGDFDEKGLSLPLKQGSLRWLHAFTALHRGWVGALGFGLIPAIFAGRLQLALESPDPGMTAAQASAVSAALKDWLRHPR